MSVLSCDFILRRWVWHKKWVCLQTTLSVIYNFSSTGKSERKVKEMRNKIIYLHALGDQPVVAAYEAGHGLVGHGQCMLRCHSGERMRELF